MRLKDHLVKNGFLFGPEQSAYPIAGFMAYPPVGKLLKGKIEAHFKKTFRKNGFVEIETPLFLPDEAWQASGHLDRMHDEMFQTVTSKGQSMRGRPEIASTIYPYFKELGRQFGDERPVKIFQSGLVLPNDRQTNWQTRTRQYTAHEGHVVTDLSVNPSDTIIQDLKKLGEDMMSGIGLPVENLVFSEKQTDAPFYADKAFKFDTGVDGKMLEIIGIQARGHHDFDAHLPKQTAKSVYEISFSSDRPFIALVAQNLTTQDGTRQFLRLPDDIVPIPAVITTKNRTTDQNSTRELAAQFALLDPDISLNIYGKLGNRYRTADAQGTPFVLAVDDQTARDNTLSVRERDTRIEKRLPTELLMRIASEGGVTGTTAKGIRRLFDETN